MYTQNDTSMNTSNIYVPNDFQGSLKARLRKVFAESPTVYTLVFTIIDHKHNGCTVRRQIDFDNPSRVEHYTKLYEEYGVTLTPNSVNKLVNQTFLLRFSQYQKDEELKQSIWVNPFLLREIPGVKVMYNDVLRTFYFDQHAKLPDPGEKCFHVWLALRVWAKRQMKASGLPENGVYDYPENIYCL